MRVVHKNKIKQLQFLTRPIQELDKLISYSGTPTVVWRRTGEICLVAPEFCMLTEWPLEDLLGAGRKKYIYEVIFPFSD